MAIDSRQRILVVGENGSTWAVARYQPNGNLNRSFGRNGRVVPDFDPGSVAKSVAIDSRDRPVVAGYVKRSRIAVARFLG